MNGNKTAQSQKMRPMHGMAGWIFHRFRALHFAYVASQVQDLHDLERLESKRKRKRTPLEIVHDLKFGWYCTYCHYISFLSIELICFPASYRCNKYKDNILNVLSYLHRWQQKLTGSVLLPGYDVDRPTRCDLDSVPMRPRSCRGARNFQRAWLRWRWTWQCGSV